MAKLLTQPYTQMYNDWEQERKNNIPIAPSGTTNAGFRQLEASPDQQYAPKQPGAVKRSLGSFGLGLLEGTEKLRSKYDAAKGLEERLQKNNPAIKPLLSGYAPLITPEQSSQYEQKLGLKGTLGESVWRGIGAETPSIAMSYGGTGAVTKGIPALQKLLTGAGKWTETGRRGVAAGAIYTPIAKEDATPKDYLENMALFGVGDVATMGLVHGAGKAFKAAKGKLGMQAQIPPVFDDMAEPVLDAPQAPPMLALPEGANWRTPTPYETFRALQGTGPKALPAGEQPLALPAGINWELGKPPAPKTFTGLIDELQPEMSAYVTPPKERSRNLIDYIHEGLGGQISKNEIRRMNYQELSSLADDIAKERQADLYNTARELASKKGHDLDHLFRMETDSAYAAERARWADVAGVDRVNMKRSAQPPEIQALNEGIQKKIGPFALGKVEHAPEALKDPVMAAANKMAQALTGKDIIFFKGRLNIHGVSDGERVFVNASSKQPHLYLASHEIAHNIEGNSPETFERLYQIVKDHVSDVPGIRAHYEKLGYTIDNLPRELTADAMAESMLEPSFWGRVRAQAPELLKPILDTLDRIIATFKQKVGKDMTIMPYLRDIEAMRGKLADEYRVYLVATKGGKLPGMGEVAAKRQLSFKQESPPSTPLGDIKNMISVGAQKLSTKGITAQRWADEMTKEFGETHKSMLEKNLGYIWHRAQELRTNGSAVIKHKGQEIPVALDLTKGGKKATKGAEANWNHVVSKTERKLPKVKEVADAAYRMTMDDLYRLKQINPEAYRQALNSRQSGGTTLFIVDQGLVDTAGNVIGPSFKSITQKIPKGKSLDFSNYLIYRHAPSWLDQGRNVFPEWEGITSDVSRQRAAAYEAQNPEFRQIADELSKFYQDFMEKWAVDGGLLERGLWENLKKQYPDYVPLMRKMEEVEQGAQGVKRGYVNQPTPVKKAEGSQREIIDPLESMMEQIDRTVKAQRRNEVGVKLYQELKAGDDLKGLIEIVPEKGDTFETVIARDGMEGFVKWLEEPFEDMVARKNAKLDRPNVARVRVNGETLHMKVNDKPLLDALTSLGPQATGGIIEAARQVTRTMKVLTTGANVFFASRNIVRDIPTSYMFSKNLSNVPGVREAQFATDLLDSMARIITGGRYDPGGHYKTYKALGGGSHSSAIASDRNLLGEAKAKALPGYYDIKHPLQTTGRGLKGAGRGIEAFTNAVETVPRLPEYIRTAKKGGDTPAARQQGLFDAQDVTVNFSKRGGMSHQADAFIPYLNASLQGLDKMGREIRANPFHLALRGITAISVPTIGLYLFNRDDPNYKQVSSFIKDNYYCIPKGDGTFIRIAKPREWGQIFGSLVERSLARWADNDPDGYRGFREAWFTNFIPPIRTIAAPIYDLAKNETFAGAPIVPGYMESLSPEMQYDETTSMPAIKLGKALGASPKKIDYAMRSYTGFIGELGIPAASQGRGQTGLQRIGEAVQKPYQTDPVYSNDIMSRFYDEKTKMDNAAADYKVSKVKSADYSEAKRKRFNAVADDISEINKRIRKINSDPSIPYEQKKEQTRALKDRANRMAERLIGK